MNIEEARFNMIEQQIRPWDVLDVDVLKIIQEIPRELFVPEQYKKIAFSDLEVPLTFGQSMMAPKVEARLLQALQIQADDEILEIGTGSGFVTACLAKLGKQVDSIEYHEDLSSQAQAILKQQEISNVSFMTGDILDEAFVKNHLDKQYDVIAVTASMPEYNELFEDLLKDNGRMFVIAGTAPAMQAKLITRIKDSGFNHINLFETNLQSLIGMQASQVFTL